MGSSREKPKRRPDGSLTLSEARTIFGESRQDRSCILPRPHSYRDHPERLFTREEIVNLVHSGRGQLHDNNRAVTALPGSFLLKLDDHEGRACELGLFLDEDGVWRIVVHHAWRKVKK